MSTALFEILLLTPGPRSLSRRQLASTFHQRQLLYGPHVTEKVLVQRRWVWWFVGLKTIGFLLGVL